MKKAIYFFTLLMSISCSTSKSIKGYYYNKCYLYHLPMLVLKIEDSIYTYYSPSVRGQKGIGVWIIDKNKLVMIEKKTITNNFYDTLSVNDTTNYLIKKRRLIPFNYKKCYFIKTKDKSKLIQIE